MARILARYRAAFRTSGAKDDPSDSALLLDMVSKHRDQLRARVPDTVAARQLQLFCEHRRKLVNQRVARGELGAAVASQIRKAATSVPMNIAERAGCASNGEFVRFLGYAYRSPKRSSHVLRTVPATVPVAARGPRCRPGR